MKRKSQLLLFQFDHLSGEEIGYLIEQVHIWGAKNAHVISTVTKKGRPGYILLVDPGEQQEGTLVKRMAPVGVLKAAKSSQEKSNHLMTVVLNKTEKQLEAAPIWDPTKMSDHYYDARIDRFFGAKPSACA